MTDLTSAQVEIERWMHQRGYDRYMSAARRAKEKGRVSHTRPGNDLIREAVPRLAAAISEWVTNTIEHQAGPNAAGIPFISASSPEITAYCTIRMVLDMMGRECTRNQIAHTLGQQLEAEWRAGELQSQQPVWYHRFLAVSKKSGWSHIRKTLKHYANVSPAEIPAWPMKGRVQAALACIELLRVSTGLFEESMVWQKAPGRKSKSHIYLVPTQETMDWFEGSNEAYANLLPFWLPTVEKPLEWKGIRGGGYHLEESQRPLVRMKTKRGRRWIEDKDLGDVVPAVNHLQGTQWEINPDIWEVLSHYWEQGGGRAGLASRDDPPIPSKPHDLDTNEDARLAWRKEAGRAYTARISVRSQRIHASRTVEICSLFQGQRFYLPYMADFRGRVYPAPYFLQPQGPSMARGLLRFREGHPIVGDGGDDAFWLAVHGANTYGFDKVTLDDRREWVVEREQDILAVGEDPIENTFWEAADSPWQFLAFCCEWWRLKEEGRTLSHIPVSIDGSNNGLQIYSLLMRDPQSAAATNVLPSSFPRDIYQDVADLVEAILRQDVGNFEPYRWKGGAKSASRHELASGWLALGDGKVVRGSVKRPVMTLPYGVTKYAAQQYVREWAEEQTKVPFGDIGGYGPALYFVDILWDAIGDTVGRAQECMGWLHSLADAFSERGEVIRWLSPAGFPVFQDYFAHKSTLVRTKIGDRVLIAGGREEKPRINPKGQRNGIAPNFVHSVDAACLAKTVLKCKQEGIEDVAVVHDSFGCHATRLQDLRRILRETYAEVFENDLLLDLHQQFTKLLGVELPPPPERGSLDVRQVLKSDYLFS